MNYSPLRYPGGKSKLAPYMLEILTKNHLVNSTYVEPYAGGAGLALDLLINSKVKGIHINDIDMGIYSFWLTLKNDTDYLINFIDKVDISMDTWYEQKEILSSTTYDDLKKLACATFFLNRTNRSGILKGGVIGGKSQAGDYKLDARFNKANLIKKIQKVAEFKDQIKVTNFDAVQLLLSFKNPKDLIVYLDPPYYVKGQGLYRNYYEHDDHVQIRDVLEKSNFDWVVSYDSNDEIKTIYQAFKQYEYKLNYSAQVKGKGQEVIIFSDRLEAPELEYI